ncbi:hypothetical protein D9M70_527690 [compost metagenome]
MAEETDALQLMAVQPVVFPSARERGFRHVQVDHLLGAAGDGGDGKTAGVGEQVQHPPALRLRPHPLAAVAHVEEQAAVLLAAQVQLEAQAVLADDALVDLFAEKELGGALQQIAVLQQQPLSPTIPPGRRVGERREHFLQCRQFALLRFAEQRHQHDALQPVDGDLLQPRPAPAAPMEQATYLVGRVAQGGAELLLQGGDGLRVHVSVSEVQNAAFYALRAGRISLSATHSPA